jgi:hypothetical protein
MLRKSFDLQFFLVAIFCFFASPAIAISDTCWALQLNGIDPEPYTQGKHISKSATLSDGFVICGTTYRDIFPSKDGNTIGRTTYGGIYLAKYDFDGNLKWLDYGIDPSYMLRQYDNLTVTTDPYDNIYICGIFPYDQRFYFNGGSSYVNIAATTDPGTSGFSFIAKLNSAGQVIWHTSVAHDQPTNITWSPNNRLIVSGNSETDDAVYIKGTVSDTISRHQVSIFSSLYNHVQFLYWLDTAGNLIKHSKINEQAVNYRGVTSMGTDANSNLYVCGMYEEVLCLPDVGMTDSIYLAPDTSGPRFYVAKYDSAGQTQWIVRDQKRLTLGSGSTPNSMSVATNGTVYVSADAGYWGATDSVYFYNSDRSVSMVHNGPWMVYSINTNGFLKWEQGGNFQGFGSGVCIKDGIVTSSAFKSEAAPAWFKDTIYSANNANLYFPFTYDGMIIARFDTVGNVLSAVRGGYSNGPLRYGDGGITPGNGGSVIVYGDASKYSITDSVVFFLDTLDFNGVDGWIVKFNEGDCSLPTVDVGQITPHADLLIYPNPIFNSDNTPLCIRSSTPLSSVVLYNTIGAKCVAWNNLELKQNTLQLPQLPAGMYFVQCTAADGATIQTRKLIVK